MVFGNISEINTQFKNIAYSVFYGQATPAEAAHTDQRLRPLRRVSG